MTEMERARQLSNDTVLVTGASGFIGSHLCRRLLAAGASVHGLYRTAPAGDPGDVRWRRIDLCDLASVHALIAELKPDLVFHLAGFVSGDRSPEAVLPALQSNLIGTVHLLAALVGTGCRRIVVAGSMEEPDASEPLPVPRSPYAAAKYAAGGYARMFHALYEVPVVVARIFMVYGPGQRDLRKLVPYVTLSLLRRQTPKLSSGSRLVDWIYVDDVIGGLLAAARAADAVGGTFDLGSGTCNSVRDVALRLSEIIDPGARLAFGDLPDRPLEVARRANVSETLERLGWCASVSIEDGLARTAAWYGEWLQAGSAEGGRDTAARLSRRD
jgi:nucleoside-diphosphate-sugar epimerase